jgi:hypothetical protein
MIGHVLALRYLLYAGVVSLVASPLDLWLNDRDEAEGKENC